MTQLIHNLIHLLTEIRKETAGQKDAHLRIQKLLDKADRILEELAKDDPQ